MIEAAARQVAAAVSRAVKAEADIDVLSRPATLIPNNSNEQLAVDTSIALVETDEQSPEIAPETVDAIASELGYGEGRNDFVFRRGARQIVILSERLDERDLRRAIGRALSPTHRARVAIATAPTHGQTLEQLMTSADELLREKRGQGHPSSRSIH